MKSNILSENSKRLSLMCAAISLLILTYMNFKFVFGSGNLAGTLTLLLIAAAFLTLVFGVISISSWQSFVSLGIFCLVAFFILFKPLYAIH